MKFEIGKLYCYDMEIPIMGFASYEAICDYLSKPVWAENSSGFSFFSYPSYMDYPTTHIYKHEPFLVLKERNVNGVMVVSVLHKDKILWLKFGPHIPTTNEFIKLS